nr:fibronectin type III domain-containing protein [Verrucomicrobiota bacterium]
QLPGFSSASALSFGGGWGGDGYVGGLCDVALWNRALSGTEIAQLYSQQMAGVNLAAAPIAPSALIAQVISGTTVQITWLDNSSNESGFVLQRSVDGTNFTTSATLPSNATAWVDTLPEPTVAYAYRVKAANSLGDSEYSGVAWVGQPSPTAPTRLRVLGVTAQ